MTMTYRQLHRAQQEGEYPNVGNSPFGFDWHDLPSLARVSPDVEVVPQQQQQQQQKQQDSEEGNNNNNNNNNNNQEQQQDGIGEEQDEQEQEESTGDNEGEGKGEDEADNGCDPLVGEEGEEDGTGRGMVRPGDRRYKGQVNDAVSSADLLGDMADDEDVSDHLQPMGQVDGEASGEEDGEVDAYDTGDGEDGDGDSLSPIVGDWDYADSLPNVGKHGGYVHEEPIPTPTGAARLMKRALSKLSGGFATGMTPLWDYSKLIKRIATRQDYNLAKKEQDGNPTVLFIGDTSGSCANMIAEMKAILMTATSMGVRGSDVWLLLASNAEVTWAEIYFRKRYPGYGDELALCQNGKEMPIENYMGNRDECVSYKNVIGNIIDAINPKVVVNVGDIDSYDVMLHMLGRRDVQTLHVYAPNRGGEHTDDGLPLAYPIEQSTPIHPYVNMIRASTTIPTSGTVNVAMVGKEDRYDKSLPPLSWRIAYAVDFFFSPEKMSQLPIVQFKYA